MMEGVAPDLVGAVQHERILTSMLRASAQLGYREVTVRDVFDRAGVSRPTFYEHFSNKEDCFLAAFDAAAARLRARLDAGAAGRGGNWCERLCTALEGLLCFVADDRDAAMVLIVEARAACPAALCRRDDLLDHFAACLDAQVRADAPEDPPSAITAAGVVGGIDALLYSSLTKGKADDPESLLPSLTYFVLSAYEGHEAARQGLLMTVMT